MMMMMIFYFHECFTVFKPLRRETCGNTRKGREGVRERGRERVKSITQPLEIEIHGYRNRNKEIER